MITYEASQKVASACVLGAGIMTDIAQTGDFPDSEQAREEMQEHYLDIHNPERFYAQQPLDPEYKAGQIRQAEATLTAEGYKIAGGEPEASLFQ